MTLYKYHTSWKMNTAQAIQLTRWGTTSGLMCCPLTALAIREWGSVCILINTAPFILAPNTFLHSAIQAWCEFSTATGTNYWLLRYQPNTSLHHLHLKGSASFQQSQSNSYCHNPIPYDLQQYNNNISMTYNFFPLKLSIWKPKCMSLCLRIKQNSVFDKVKAHQFEAFRTEKSDSELCDLKLPRFLKCAFTGCVVVWSPDVT